LHARCSRHDIFRNVLCLRDGFIHVKVDRALSLFHELLIHLLCLPPLPACVLRMLARAHTVAACADGARTAQGKTPA
jgi:hypothetical protein